MSDMADVILRVSRLDLQDSLALARELSAAGFGRVQEAAAAGVRSVHDIWGSVGRATVRMGEIRDADQTILSGEWDNHIKWNMADIARERARASREDT